MAHLHGRLADLPQGSVAAAAATKTSRTVPLAPTGAFRYQSEITPKRGDETGRANEKAAIERGSGANRMVSMTGGEVTSACSDGLLCSLLGFATLLLSSGPAVGKRSCPEYR